MSVPTMSARSYRKGRGFSGPELGVLVASCLGSMVTFFLITASVSSLGAIQSDLALSPGDLVWVPSSYALMVASLVLTGGTLGDRYGRRRAFVVGSAVLVAATVVVLATHTFAGLLAGELLAGVGGALVLPNSLAMVSLAFTDAQRRTEAITAWVASSGIGLAIGPITSGWVLQHLDWRLAFVPVIGVSVVAMVCALRFGAESRRPEARVDAVGALTATLAIAGLVYGLIQGGQDGYGEVRVLLALATSAVAALVFVMVELRVGRPMLDVRLLANPSFAAVLGIAAVALFGFTGMAISLVLFYEKAQGLDALQTGWRLLPMFGGYVLVAMRVGGLVRRLGFKAPLVGGLVLVALSVLGLLQVDQSDGYRFAWPLLLLVGAGVALVAGPSTAAAMMSVDQQDAGMAASAVNAARQVGSVMGSSIIGSVLTAQFLDALPGRLSRAGLPPGVRERIETAASHGGGARGPQPGVVTRAVADAFTSGVHDGWVIVVVVFAAAAILALILVRNRTPGAAA